MKPQDIWNAAYHQLELQLDRASFDTWLRSSVFLRMEDNVFVVGVQNSYVQDMLQQRLYRNVCRILTDICGEEADVAFEIYKPEVTSSQAQSYFDSEQAPLFRFLAQRQKAEGLPETDDDPPQTALQHLVTNPQHRPLPESELNPRYTFERFIVNKSNQVVYEAALAVADYPATVYNPFFIYGGVGLGKTHLLQSVAHICQHKGLRSIYIPSEVFTNDLVSAIRNRSTAMFRDKYRTADVLLVDDVQFISGKDSTQEEFFHTFNALVNFNKQIVLASDRHPREMKTLEDRLRSRFQGGLVADIAPPEYETRVAILQMWVHERQAQLNEDVLAMVAQRSPGNIRELEGLFNQILAQSRLYGGQLNLPDAQQTLARYAQPRERVTLQRIIDVAAQRQGFKAGDLTGKRRTARVNRARQIAMYIARAMTEYSLPQIGEAFGGRSHTTVLHGANKIAEEVEVDKLLEAKINTIRAAIAGRRS